MDNCPHLQSHWPPYFRDSHALPVRVDVQRPQTIPCGTHTWTDSAPPCSVSADWNPFFVLSSHHDSSFFWKKMIYFWESSKVCGFCSAYHSAFEPWYKLVPWFLMPHEEEFIFCGVSGLLFFPCKCLAPALFWPVGWAGDICIVYQLFCDLGLVWCSLNLVKEVKSQSAVVKKKKKCSTSVPPQTASQTTITLLKGLLGSWRLDIAASSSRTVLSQEFSGFPGFPRALGPCRCLFPAALCARVPA